jgi:hypothetical protein
MVENSCSIHCKLKVVDGNVIRLTAVQVVTACVIAIIWRKHAWAHYLVLGLLLDNLLRLFWGAGPSPLGQIARCAAVPFQPRFRPGVPKQFAIACGTMMSALATIFLFTSGYDNDEILPAVILAVYAFLAFLEGSIDFCMGCVMFGWGVKFGIFPNEVYALGIACKPEYEYTYDDSIKHIDLPEPERLRVGYPNKPPSAIDVRYKVKSNDHDRQSSHMIKYAKVTHFNIVLAVCGLAALWRAAALPELGGAAGLNVSNSVGDVFAIAGTVIYVIFTGL